MTSLRPKKHLGSKSPKPWTAVMKQLETRPSQNRSSSSSSKTRGNSAENAEKNQLKSISTCQSPHLLLLPLYLQVRHQVGLPVKRVRWRCALLQCTAGKIILKLVSVLISEQPQQQYKMELGKCVNNLTTECSPSTSCSVHEVAFTTPCHRGFHPNPGNHVY